ncbi:OLC1v1025762C1 [Oldenlandia corymbosa var. corymbosa]|nr:OLC1v1025762C1 [Oldenlandia corymbosa var. corymbosa]
MTRVASAPCFQSKGFPFDPHRFPVQELQVPNDGHTHEGRDILEPDHQSLNADLVDTTKENKGKHVFPPEMGTWSAFHPDPGNLKLCHLRASDGQFYPFFVDNHIRYTPINMIPLSYPFKSQLQEFQYFVVIDFEATCDKDKNPHPQEIIEFPSVIVNSMTGHLEACYQTYVRPTCNQKLSDFCMDLTGIQQSQVDKGVPLGDALLSHDKWLEEKGIKNTNFAVVTWSNWDCEVMLESECRYKKIKKPPYFNRWINLKVPFREVFGGVRCNLKEAVQLAGLEWQGRAHCGLDDAKNTARLLSVLMHKGYKFSITDSLMCPPTNETFSWKLPQDYHSIPSYHPQRIRAPPVSILQLHPHCFCGVRSREGMFRRPGLRHGSPFFGCGNWTMRGPRCHYFEWASK